MKRIQLIEMVSACIFLGTGIGLILVPAISTSILYWSLVGVFTASNLVFLIHAIISKKPMLLAGALIMGVFAVTLYFIPRFFVSFIFSFYMLFCGICYGIQWQVDKKTGCKHSDALIACIAYLCLWLFILLCRKQSDKVLQSAMGIYLIFQGLQLFWIHTRSVQNKSWGSRLMSHWTSLPVGIVSFLPFVVVELMDKQITPKGGPDFNQCKNERKPDLFVYIHTGTTGVHVVGHMTFCFDGLMYSYGNYAKKQEKLHGTLGNAVFFTAPPEIYINNSCIYEGTTLYGYGIALTPDQKEKLRANLKNIMKDTVPWQCPVQKDLTGPFNKYEKDYASRLYWRTGAKFLQFTKDSRWKIYWVLGTNCSLFAETVLASASCDIVQKKGIVSPGEYFEYLEEQFANPASPVVCRQWHTAKLPCTLYKTWA